MTSFHVNTRRRAVAWRKDGERGAEFAMVDLGPDCLSAEGIAIGLEPEPYRLDYKLETASQFVPLRVHVATQGEGWRRQLDLHRKSDGNWGARVDQEGTAGLPDAGGDARSFAGALDVDLELSPLFNTMPVLRRGLHRGGEAIDFLMIWISVPDLSLHPSPQRYTYVQTRSPDERVVRFEAVGDGDDFAADVLFDADGLVIDYPGIATQMRGGNSR